MNDSLKATMSSVIILSKCFLFQNESKSDANSSPSQPSFNVMQMINAIKSQPATNTR